MYGTGHFGQSVLNCQYVNVWGSYKVWIIWLMNLMTHKLWVIQCESYLFHMAFVKGLKRSADSVIVHSKKYHMVRRIHYESVFDQPYDISKLKFSRKCHEVRRLLKKISSRKFLILSLINCFFEWLIETEWPRIINNQNVDQWRSKNPNNSDNEENKCTDSTATWIFFTAECAHATKHHQQVKDNQYQTDKCCDCRCDE